MLGLPSGSASAPTHLPRSRSRSLALQVRASNIDELFREQQQQLQVSPCGARVSFEPRAARCVAADAPSQREPPHPPQVRGRRRECGERGSAAPLCPAAADELFVKDGARYVARHRLPPCEPLPPRASACRATTPPPRRPSPPRPSLPLPRLGHRLRRRPRRRPRPRRPRRRRPRRRPRPPPSPPPSPGASLLAATSLAARAASLAPSFSVRACTCVCDAVCAF